MRKPKRILVIRTDRMGDVILSTPVFGWLKRAFPETEIVAMVSPTVAPLLRDHPHLKEVWEYRPSTQHRSTSGFFALIRQIRQGRFDVALVLHSDRRVAAAVFAAGIRTRVGPLSKPHSFLFFNRGVRQRRSRVDMHEADYNNQLLKRLGIRVHSRTEPTQISVSEGAVKFAKDWLKDQGFESGQKLVVIHPGMGGSALNWPESHYQELVAQVEEMKDTFVVVSGSRLEEGMVAQCLQGSKKSHPFVGQSLENLAGLYNLAKVVVAPSTGPLHLAVALGKRVVTFFPPVRVQSAIRWGPYRNEEDSATIFVPDVYCGQDFKCIGNLCNYYPCMKSLSVQDAAKEVKRHLLEKNRSFKVDA